MSTSTQNVIELGGGGQPRYCKKFGNGVNLDVRKIDDFVDIVADFEKPFPVDSLAYDFVYCQYVIEHISWRNIEQFISEVYRITAKDGHVMILAPNMREQCKILANKKEWSMRDLQMVFGDQDYQQNAHRSSMSPEMAESLFRKAGFSKVIVYPHPYTPTDFILEAFK